MDEVRTYFNDIKYVAHLSNLPWFKLSGKNILITGATGLIGGCVVDILMNRNDIDYHVYAAGRNEFRAAKLFSKYEDFDKFHFIKMDVTKPLLYNIPFHYIISCASGANPVVYSTQPVDTIMTNLLGVDNLMKYGINNGLEKFIYISSGDVYGEGDGLIFSEEYSGYVNPMILRSCYPSAKRAAESLCVAYASQYNVDVSVARPCHIYGPYFTESDTRAYAQFFRNAIAGEDIVLKSSGAQLRSWCYVIDCAAAILYVALLGISREAYNIADRNSILTVRQFAETIASIVGRRVVIDAPSDVEFAGFNTVTRSVFDTAKLESLGWQPIKNFRSNVLTSIEYLLQNENHFISNSYKACK